MNDTLIQDSINTAVQVVSKITESVPVNWWKWFALTEFGIIILLILKRNFKPKETARQRFKQDALKQDIDFNNIINSSFHSTQLYDELKVKCHPDLFPTDKEKNTIAEKIFQEITKNKNNFKRLLELKEEAIQKLNINL